MVWLYPLTLALVATGEGGLSLRRELDVFLAS
jgi:hypothetical protein